MKKKKIIDIIRSLGIFIQLSIGISIISIYIISTYYEYNKNITKLKSNYVNTQKKRIKEEVFRVVNMINYEKDHIHKFNKKKVKSSVYKAYSIIENSYEQYKNTKNNSEIQKIIINYLRSINLENKNENFFMIDLTGKAILFTDNPKVEGKNILNMKDINNKYIIKDMTKTSKTKNEGFYEYYWKKTNTNGNNLKIISFIKLFKPYNWYIGTGLYVNDIEKQIKENLISRISRIKFGKNGYIFINRENGDALLSNGKKFSGKKKLWEEFSKYPIKLKNIFKKEYNASLKPNGDYIYYSWIKSTNSKKIFPKASFIYKIPEFNWIIGAGVYLDNIEKDILILKNNLYYQLKLRILYFIIIIIFIIFLFLFFLNKLNNKLNNDFRSFNLVFDQVASSNNKINRELFQFYELDQLAENANKILQNKINAEKELLNEKKWLSTIIHSITNGVIAVDIFEKIKTINSSAEKLTGYSYNETKGKLFNDIFNVIHKDSLKPIKNIIKKVIKTKKTFNIKDYKILINKNNEEFKIYISASPIRNSDNIIIGVIVIFKNITYEIESKAENERIYKILEQTPDIISTALPNQKILYMNSSGRKLINWKYEDKTPKNIAEFHPYWAFQIIKNIGLPQAIKNGFWEGETAILNNNGLEIPVSQMILSHKNSTGEVETVSTIMRDLSKYKAMETQLQQAQKMRAIGQLAGGISHDFNNLLMGIIGNSELLLINKNIDKESLELARLIKNIAIRGGELTSKLLAFSRKEKNYFTNIDINNIIDETIDIIKSTLNKNISLSLIKNAEKFIIFGDRSGIQNSLLNLCINADNAMPNGGEILIETNNIKINNDQSNKQFALKTGEYIQIIIKDNGCGISKENLEKIFEPFFTTKKQGEGSGLGLASVYGIIQKHKGKIDVYSKINHGTSFHILLPCSSAKNIELSNKKVIFGKGKILLVDDEEIIRTTIKKLLESIGYDVIIAKNGNNAIKIFKEKYSKIDVVLLDMIMPGIDGYETFIKMKKIDKNSKIIISSGFSKNKNIDELKKLGLSGYINKPYETYTLAKLLSDVLKP